MKRITGEGSKKLEIALKNLSGSIAKAGWVTNKQYDESQMTTAGAAYISEYGSPAQNIPSRPHGRPTIAENQAKWAKIAEAESKRILNGQQTSEGAMEILGLQAAGDWRETITKLLDPPLSPRTIAARLRKRKDKKSVGALDKPLIDTGIMLNSLTNVVEHE